VIGITNVNYVAGNNHLAVVDATLAGTPAEDASSILRQAAAALPAAKAQTLTSQPTAAAGETVQASIDNFNFTPKELSVKTGTTVRWTNKDDIPHTVTSDDKVFASPVLDTNQNFQFTFANAGTFPYYCRLHPKMTGKVVVA
jgi:3',5'-cyclic-AMP phosphodiesterase